MFKNQKGITLITLVITIVVLLILAGVGLNLVLGSDGLLTRAQEAENDFTQSQSDEVDQMNALESWMDQYID